MVRKLVTRNSKLGTS